MRVLAAGRPSKAHAERRAGLLAAAVVLAALAVALPVTPALASGSPHARLELAAVPAASLGCEEPQFVPELKFDEVFATRARIVAVARISNVRSPEVKWSGEYATSESGPWTPAGGETLFSNEIAVGLGADDATTVMVMRSTKLKRRSFTTSCRKPPNISLAFMSKMHAARSNILSRSGRLPRSQSPKSRPTRMGGLRFTAGASSPTSAGFTAQVESNGAATEYGFEYTTEPGSSGSWKPFTSGATGTISVAEDFANPEAKLTGLKPETTYFVRLKVTNEKGGVVQKSISGKGGAELESFTTPTRQAGSVRT